MSRGMIANAAGVARQAIAFIEVGTYDWVLLDRANAILGVTVHPHPAQTNVLSVGAVRRMQALRALGFTVPYLADRIGAKRQNLLAAFDRPKCMYERWVAIRDLYDELSTTPARALASSPNARARALAARSGFLLPMEWEGYDIDDPRVTPPRSVRKGRVAQSKQPDEVLVQRILDGKWSGVAPKLERQAAFETLQAQGLSASQIGERLDVTARTVQRLRSAA